MDYFLKVDVYPNRRLIFIIFLLVFCALSPIGMALDPQKEITQYIHEVWGLEDGLPQNSVYAVIQSGDGYLWLGTQEGLVRFDGIHFKVYSKRNLEQISNNWIRVLHEDQEGNLWIGTYGGGLICLKKKDGEFINFTKKQGLSNDRILSICEDQEGNLWIGTEGGLNCLSCLDLKGGKSSFIVYTAKEGLSNDRVYSICEDREGSLWIGTYGGGLNRLDRLDLKYGKFSITTYTTKEGLSDDRVYSICEDREGGLWIGTEGGLNCLSCLDLREGKSSFTTYTVKEGLSNDRVSSIDEDREGNLWIATLGGGLNRLNRRNLKDGKFTFTAYTTKEGLSNDHGWSIYEDREGSLWIGTNGGLNRLKDGKFTAYTTKEGLSNDMVSSIYKDRKGNLWIGTYGGGLNRLNPKDGKFTVFTAKQGLSNNIVWSIYEDRKGSLWIGTEGGGLNCLNHLDLKEEKYTFTAYTTKEGLSNDNIRSICEDRKGNLWIGTDDGLNRLNVKDGIYKFTTYKNTIASKGGLSNDTITFIYEDRKGFLWIGTDGGGLNRLNSLDSEDGKFTFNVYTTKEGLSHDIVSYIYEDQEGSLWIGTYGGGLNRLKDGKFTNVTFKEGLFDDIVYSILEDDRGNLWMSCNKGIFRVSKKELNDFFEGRTNTNFVHSVSYDEKDGMKSRECNGGRQPAGWKSHDGKLWFPTMKGVVKIDPNNIKINRLPPPVKIEEITADNKKIHPPFSRFFSNKEALVLTPGSQRLEIYYTALSLLVPERVRFKYKLEGFDKEWRLVGTRRTAYYTKIPPGNYTFLVKGCNNDGVWNETGASVSFYLKPYFYQTWWFYMICVCAVVFFIGGIYRLRVKQLQKRKRELEKANKIARKEREIAQREREIADAANRAKSEFLARMSHELRTPMNAVIGFAEMLMNTGLTGEQLDYTRIIRRSSETLTLLLKDILDFSMLEAGELDMTLSDFDPKRTALNVCEIARPQVEGKPVEMRCHINDNVPAYVKGDSERFRQVLLNLLSNAAKFTKEGEIELSLYVEEEQKERIKFHVTVRDTGIGIPADKLEVIFDVFQQVDGSDTRKYGGSGVGLSISRQIAKLMGGDILAESTPGKGAIFHFTAWMDRSKKEPEKAFIPKPLPGKKALATDETKHPGHVLLAEDNPINRKLVSFILTKAGYRLTAVNDGKEAVDVYAADPGRFNLILMDIQMPVMNGREATKKIREIESSTIKDQPAAHSPHIPIIAITAQSVTGDWEKCIEAGMDDYIAKPIEAEVVLQMVKKWVLKNRPS